MLDFLIGLFSSKDIDYDAAKQIAVEGPEGKRLSLAKSSETHKEILYYLAEKDPSAKVRKAVAKNKSTPLQASPILATDTDEDVRMALAGRMVELLPELSVDKQSQLYAFAVQTLGTLALDEVLKIRKALSSTLKDHAHTPPKVAAQLAKDIEREVAEPILRFCAALADEDLLDILKSHPSGWAVEAIAARETISEDVSEAVIEADHPPAGAILIQNEGAQLTPSLIEHIVDRARDYSEWHAPLAIHTKLPPDAAKILAGFVDRKVRDLLLNRSDLDSETVEEISDIMQRRLIFEDESGGGIEARVKQLYKDGKLTEDMLSDALGMRHYDFVTCALSALANASLADVKRIIEMKAAKPVVALAWKADLSMRFALRLQQELARVSSKELIYPKDGTDYPFAHTEIKEHLAFLGLGD